MSILMVSSMLAMLALPGLPDIRVELVPSNPGPYQGGESFVVDVWLHNEMDEDVRLIEIRFDFEESASEFVLGPQFTFDFSSLESPQNSYMTDPDLPRPHTNNTIACFCAFRFLPLSTGGSLHIGSVPIELPIEGGTYRLDALNADATDWFHGVMIEVGYSSNKGERRADTGEIVGGQFDFIVTPPPIPTVSEWGFMTIWILLMITGTLTILRNQRGGWPRS